MHKFSLVNWYSAAYCFVNFTYEDNYPTVNIEAQLCGARVITYRTGGSVENVPANNVIDKGDVSLCASKILKNNIDDADEKNNVYMTNQYILLYKQQ